MKIRTHLFIGSGLLLLSAQLQAEQSIPVLHSIAIQENTIVFEVTSYGCSRDEDFELQVEDGASITLIRNRVDRCKRAPMAIQIKRSLEKYGLSLQQPFSVRNPFIPPPVKHRPPAETSTAKKRAVQE
jgi:hypothetical protein